MQLVERDRDPHTAPARRPLWVWLLAVSGAAGCGEQDELTLVGLRDGAYVGGFQVSAIETSTRSDVLRAELFLDGLRIAQDELAPFELTWDTRNFAEGIHRLTARAYLDGDARVEGSVTVQIDNTAPVVGDVATVATRGSAFEIAASDNGLLDHVEVWRGVADEAPLILSSPPFRFEWPWCGPVALQVRAVDAAGGVSARSAAVFGTDLQDRDCDGHAPPSLGGDDCNDTDATISTAAPEQRDAIDRDCDGVAGIVEGADLDRDGVPSIADGGNDCDDANPAVHGEFFVAGDEPIRVNGEPVTWSDGEASFLLGGLGWSLALNRGGGIDVVSARIPEPTRIATGANPTSIATSFDHLAFGRGNQVVIKRLEGGTWSDAGGFESDAPVGRLTYSRPQVGVEYAVFQAGTKVWFASGTAGIWTTQLLVDAGAPLAEAPLLNAAPYGANVTFRSARAAWTASRSGTDVPLTTRRIGPEGAIPTAVAGDSSAAAMVAVEQDGGAAVYADGFAEPILTFPSRVTRLVVSSEKLLVLREGLGVQVVLPRQGYRIAQTIPNITAFDAHSFAVFATSGHVFVPTSRSVFAAREVMGDEIDQDCNGSIEF